MEMQVIKNKSTLELQQHEETLRAQLFAFRIQSSLGKLETPHMINALRKDIARIKTELTIRIKNGEKIKPLHINKMILPEEKKESKKVKKIAKVDKKDIKESDKDDNKVVTEKTVKAKSPSKKTTVKKTVTPSKEDKE